MKVYAAYSKDEEIRRNSSSGGLYRVIAEHIIKNGGVVFASVYEGTSVKYVEINTTGDLLSNSQGAKYVPSKLNDTFKKIKEYLVDKQVLFVGLPCQCAGLYSYIGTNFSNLITVSIVCHGVPSPKAWNSYLKGKNIVSVNMRDKSRGGWSGYNWKIYNGKREILIHHDNVSYMTGFTKDFYLRPSCYECKFKTEIGDITLGDFWGIQNIAKEMFDDKGTSIVCTNTEKGQAIFDLIKKYLEYKEIFTQEYKKYNAGFSVAHRTEQRNQFFMRLNQGEKFDHIVDNLSETSLIIRLKRKVKELIGNKSR